MHTGALGVNGLTGVRIEWANFMENVRAFGRDQDNCP